MIGVAGRTGRRRLATVLFVDIVGSTTVASSLGDARWRELLTRFRRVVRSELKRFGGREQDTAGDGFFATFSEPARALGGAAAIVEAVQQFGIDVRGGIHTGECEQIDGKLGGIAVHLGSRVMALAGPAEVLVTGTVKDLVAGSGASFAECGAAELKGVDGAWQIYSLQAVTARLPPPLAPAVAAERLALVVPSASARRKRLALGGALVAVAFGAVGGIVATEGGQAHTLITPTSIGGAGLGLEQAAYIRAFGTASDSVGLNYPPNWVMQRFPSRDVNVYYAVKSLGPIVNLGKTGQAIEITTWNRADRTAAGIGPCSTLAQLKAAYGSRLTPQSPSPDRTFFFAYRLGKNLLFAMTAPRGGVVQSVALTSDHNHNEAAFRPLADHGQCVR
jgi:class 3 adenylate cyclase